MKDPSWKIQITAAKALKVKGLYHLYKIIDRAPIQYQIQAVKAVTQIQGRNCIDKLKIHYKISYSEELQTAIIQSFRSIGDKELNDFLLDILADSDDRIKLEVIHAFETCGTLSAVEPLFNINKKILVNPAIKAASKNAIDTIQARLAKNKQAGWLTLSDKNKNDGLLSLTDDKTGNGSLSLKDQESNE